MGIEITELINTVKNTLIRHSMVRHGDAILVALSGGADSIALVHILLNLSPEFDLRLGIAHLNHSMRAAESDRDADFVKSTADKLNLPCFIKKVDVNHYATHHKLSIEEAGRILRHQFLNETAREHGFNKIALGHHKNDMAETVLLNILRGTGPQGISGIPPVRGLLIRPLINISRSDIENYLSCENISHITDSSNMDPQFLRNRIRHGLIPLLVSEFNPEIVETLNHTAEIIRDEQRWIDSLTDCYVENVKLPGDRSKTILSIPELKKLPLGAIRRIIRKVISETKGNLQGVGFKHMDAVLEIILSKKPKNQVDVPGMVRIKREHDGLEFVRRRNRGKIKGLRNSYETGLSPFEYRIDRPQTVYIKEIDQSIQLAEMSAQQVLWLKKTRGYTITCQEAYMDMASISYPLMVRSFRPGDRFTPMGLSGSQKVKKFFINHKVPFPVRKNIPILECAGKIIWVGGYRIDDSVKVKESTQKVLKARLLSTSTI